MRTKQRLGETEIILLFLAKLALSTESILHSAGKNYDIKIDISIRIYCLSLRNSDVLEDIFFMIVIKLCLYFFFLFLFILTYRSVRKSLPALPRQTNKEEKDDGEEEHSLSRL